MPSSPARKITITSVPDDPARFEEAIAAFRKRIPMPKEEWESLLESERAFAFTVANVAEADLIAQAYEAIDRAITEGTTLEDFKAEIGASLEEAWGGEIPGRLETIFRTNVQGAYNEGRYEIMTAPTVKKTRPFWRFDAIEDDRTSEICSGINGTILPVDDSFWSDHVPPLHFNCRSQLVPLDLEDVDDEGGADDEAPEIDADEGFGAAPTKEGEDWKPDPDDYPGPIGDELRSRLR